MTELAPTSTADTTASGRAPLLRRVRLADLRPDEQTALVDRAPIAAGPVRDGARAIVEAVRIGGDAAVREANRRFGGALAPTTSTVGTAGEPTPAPLRLEPRDLALARDRLPADLRAALETMIANVERFHRIQVPPAEQWVAVAPGVDVGRVWRPIERVGVYVPGGEAAYPSSLVMAAVPARLAGVRDLVVASPAARDGHVSAVLAGAAGLLGIEEFLVMGGAQAVAAMAWGTASVRPVDKIVGPGNAWVTAAKLEVFGRVGIDLPAGPSEVMVLADGTADPRFVAADLLSQAEHGPDSAAVLVTTDAGLIEAVEREVARQLPTLPRHAFLRTSLAAAGLLIEAPDLSAAIGFVNAYAPEHLSIVMADDVAVLGRLGHAGSVFLGAMAPESAGDYATGANHVLPTGRLARAFGALSVETFGTWVQVQRVSRDGLAGLRDTVGLLARAEGLEAHRRAVEIRFEAAS